MNFPGPERRWHQFSLSGLLLFCTLVAILCSVGASTHWGIAMYVVAMIVIAGASGGMVAGRRTAFIAGAVYGSFGVVFAIVAITFVMFPASALWSDDAWRIACGIALPIGGILGGVLGGISVRRR
jgi:hypothetical protein